MANLIAYPPLQNAKTQTFIDATVSSPTGNLTDDFKTGLASVAGVDVNAYSMDDLWKLYLEANGYTFIGLHPNHYFDIYADDLPTGDQPFPTIDDGSETLIGYWTEDGTDGADAALTYITSQLGGTFRVDGGIAWDPTGTYFTHGCNSPDRIVTYSCTTPFDPSTATAEVGRTTGMSNPACMRFIDEGTKIQFVDTSDRLWIIQAGTTPYTAESDTATNLQLYRTSKGDTSPGISFNGSNDGPVFVFDAGGKLFWMAGDGSPYTGTRLRYAEMPGYDIENITPTIPGPTINTIGSPQSNSQTTMLWNEDGSEFLQNISSGTAIDKYTLSTPFDPTTCSKTETVNLTAGSSGQARRLIFMDSRGYLWVATDGTVDGLACWKFGA